MPNYQAKILNTVRMKQSTILSNELESLSSQWKKNDFICEHKGTAFT